MSQQQDTSSAPPTPDVGIPLEPVGLPAEPKPGWTTSEFLATVMVHAISVLAVLLDLLHVNWSKGLSTVEAAIPVLAIAISGLLQAAYSDHRTKLKVNHLQELARVRIVQIEKEISNVESVTTILNSAAPLLPAPLAQSIQQAEGDVGKIVAAATSPVVLAPTINLPTVCARCGATEVTDNRQ